jgi:fatty-acyl-CoA synthase
VSSSNFSDVVDVHRSRRPDAPALITADRTWTYEDVAATVHAFASYLQASGIRRGDRVALLGMNSAQYVNALLAVYRIGAIAVPLNYRLQEDELEYLLTNSGCISVLADAEFTAVMDRVGEILPPMHARVCLHGSGSTGWVAFDDAVADHLGAVVPSEAVGPEDIQRIMYTSGTTSRPKGVLVTHGMVQCNVAAMTGELQLTAADRILVSSPLYHIAGLDAPGLGTLFTGGALVIMRKFDASQALRLIQVHRITGGIFVQAMLHALRDARGEGADLSSVKWLIFGAAAGELYGDIRRQFPTARLIQSYGLTEGCSMVSCIPERLAVQKYGTVGTAVSFVEFRVVNSSGKEVPAGETGEIVIRGSKVTPGYWAADALTQSGWRDGWFHTGDVGLIDADGCLSITDRLKDMIRSGGENVSGAEIERVIYSHPAVHEVAVIGVPDERWQEVPKAFVVLKEGFSLQEDELVAFCRQKLASFKTPKYVEFLSLLPRNPSGKVLKKELRSPQMVK